MYIFFKKKKSDFLSYLNTENNPIFYHIIAIPYHYKLIKKNDNENRPKKKVINKKII